MPSRDIPSRKRGPARFGSRLRGFFPPGWPGPVKKRRGKGKDDDLGGVPVEPNRPLNLTGGAAAELEFDDER